MLKRVDFKNRIDELDLLKGFAVIIMILNHIFYDFGYAFGNSFMNTSLQAFSELSRSIHKSTLSRALTYTLCSSVFIGVAGTVSSFARHTFREGIILTVISVGITVVSAIASCILNEKMTIWFGILHLMAICMLLSPLLKKLPLWSLPFLSIACFSLGIYFHTIVISNQSFKFLAVFNFKCVGFSSADYYPILPHISFYIAGLFIGKCFYADNPVTHLKFTSSKVFFPLRFLGAYTFEVYVIHQVVLYAVIYLIAVLI